MSQNIEIKARFRSQSLAGKILRDIKAVFTGQEEQRDTFYHVGKGRLKLREINGKQAFLIPYLREDSAEASASFYTLLPVLEIAKSKELLAHILGVAAVVEKTRKIYRYQNVRIHLDQVKHLGTFIEFEAVQDKKSRPEKEKEKLDFLMTSFGIAPNDLVAVAYVDLLIKKSNNISLR